MRLAVFSLATMALACVTALGQEKGVSVQPIKVVALDHKEPVTFEKDIEPILVKKCSFCHSGNVKEGKFDMGSFETLMKGGKHGKPIVPGSRQKACSSRRRERANGRSCRRRLRFHLRPRSWPSSSFG